MPTIFTLNSRSNCRLEVTRDYFSISAQRMRCEIQELHTELIDILKLKGIEYEKLKSALVPSLDKQEAAFIFDSTAFDSDNYGHETFRQILPLLEAKSKQSILAGDLLGNDQYLVAEILLESMVLSRPFTFKHSTLLYCVYINNLSNAALQRLHQNLANCQAYLGHILTTIGSRAKTYISLSVVNFILKNEKTLIVAHEDDRDNSENINITPFPLEDFGYKVVSLQECYFSIFLAFKIERPSFKGFQIDTELALNAISNKVALFDDYTVHLDDAKHDYLKNAGKLKKAGLTDASRDNITALIKSNLSSNYIYNLVFLEEHEVMKFNLMLEVQRHDGNLTRNTAALEYLPARKVLRVITFI